METAVANAEASGFVLPHYDPANYPGRKFARKSDLEVYGSGSPMSGVLGYGASNVPEDEAITRGVGKVSIGDHSKTNTPGKSSDNQRNVRKEGPSTRRVQLGKKTPTVTWQRLPLIRFFQQANMLRYTTSQTSRTFATAPVFLSLLELTATRLSPHPSTIRP